MIIKYGDMLPYDNICLFNTQIRNGSGIVRKLCFIIAILKQMFILWDFFLTNAIYTFETKQSKGTRLSNCFIKNIFVLETIMFLRHFHPSFIEYLTIHTLDYSCEGQFA